MTTARNLAVDRIHRDQVLALKIGLLVGPNRAEVPVKNTVISRCRLDQNRGFRLGRVPLGPG